VAARPHQTLSQPGTDRIYGKEHHDRNGSGGLLRRGGGGGPNGEDNVHIGRDEIFRQIPGALAVLPPEPEHDG